MRTPTLTPAALLSAITLVVSLGTAAANEPQKIASPNGQIGLIFELNADGRPSFAVTFHDWVIATGMLGLEFEGAANLVDHFSTAQSSKSSVDETYQAAVGKASTIRNHHNELVATLSDANPLPRELELVFRVFDDGVAFRYRVPGGNPSEPLVLSNERTQLTFPTANQCRYMPVVNYQTSYERYYESKRTDEIDATQLLALPMVVTTSNRALIAVTEADLHDYAGAYLARDADSTSTFSTRLSPHLHPPAGLPPGVAKVIATQPLESPWRLLMIADDWGPLLESNLVFNLSDPCEISDCDWIKPGKTTFPWWNHYVLGDVDFEPGVNTATMKHYIDFCAENGIPYHSLDGLDIAWYGGPIAPQGPTDVTTPAPSIDMPELLEYAQAKGVRLRLWMHWRALQPQIDTAFATYEKWGIEGVMVDFMDRDDQEMVAFYHEMAEKAAKHHLTLTLHGAYKPTGIERTWPNVLSYEAVLNQEYNKWSSPGNLGTHPKHNLDAAMIRMLAGPLDYHQGGMRNVLPQDFVARNAAPPVQGTRGHQLAMYIVYQNHLPMMADFPAAYRGQPDLPFLVSIPCTWDETRVIHSELGQCIVIARRHGVDWYVAGMTADRQQTLTLSLDFLDQPDYTGELYIDDPSAGPTNLIRTALKIKQGEALPITLPASGGFAGRLSPASQSD